MQIEWAQHRADLLYKLRRPQHEKGGLPGENVHSGDADYQTDNQNHFALLFFSRGASAQRLGVDWCASLCLSKTHDNTRATKRCGPGGVRVTIGNRGGGTIDTQPRSNRRRSILPQRNAGPHKRGAKRSPKGQRPQNTTTPTGGCEAAPRHTHTNTADFC